MVKKCLVLLALVAFSLPGFSAVSMLYPIEAQLVDGQSIQAGSVAPGQVFDLVLSDNSGYNFEWDTVAVDRASLPRNWVVVSEGTTDSSLVASIKVPDNAAPNVYVVKLVVSNSENPSIAESVDVRVVVSSTLIKVSFSSKGTDDFAVVGKKALYSVLVTNSSIAPQDVRISSTLPSIL